MDRFRILNSQMARRMAKTITMPLELNSLGSSFSGCPLGNFFAVI
jgi:hypothetical protein